MSSSKRALGRGLGALLGAGAIAQGTPYRVRPVSLESIEPNPYQPRRMFSEDSIQELARSIQQGQLLQPIALRESGDSYQIINGERRFRAFQFLQRSQIPAIVLDLDDRDMLLSALVENVQREDLNAIDEAISYQTLSSEFGLTHEEIAVKVGKSRSHISNSMRLLKLPESVRNFIESGLLTPGGARALLPLEDSSKLKRVASDAIVHGWNVRQLEAQVKLELNDLKPGVELEKKQVSLPPEEIVLRLKALFHQPVELKRKKSGFELKLNFSDEDLLQGFLSKWESATRYVNNV
jgi:ParB family transcriptional regulator, chromosome partitioning protein